MGLILSIRAAGQFDVHEVVLKFERRVVLIRRGMSAFMLEAGIAFSAISFALPKKRGFPGAKPPRARQGYAGGLVGVIRRGPPSEG